MLTLVHLWDALSFCRYCRPIVRLLPRFRASLARQRSLERRETSEFVVLDRIAFRQSSLRGPAPTLQHAALRIAKLPTRCRPGRDWNRSKSRPMPFMKFSISFRIFNCDCRRRIISSYALDTSARATRTKYRRSQLQLVCGSSLKWERRSILEIYPSESLCISIRDMRCLILW